MFKALRRMPHWRYKVALGLGMGLLGAGMIGVGIVLGGLTMIAYIVGGVALWGSTALALRAAEDYRAL